MTDPHSVACLDAGLDRLARAGQLLLCSAEADTLGMKSASSAFRDAARDQARLAGVMLGQVNGPDERVERALKGCREIIGGEA